MSALRSSVPVTLLHGDSPFLIDRAARELVAAALAGDDPAYGLTVADLAETSLAEGLALLRTGSLLADTRVVWLRSVDSLKAPDQKVLAEALGALTPGTSVIMTAVLTPQQARRNKPVGAALSRAVEQHGQSQGFVTPYEAELAAWLIAEARALGKTLARQAAEELVELVGRDHARLHSELLKLCDYVGDAKSISRDAVRAVASRSAESSSFALVDAIAEGDARGALAMLPDIVPAHAAVSAAIPLLGSIARQLRLMWQARYLAERGSPVDQRRAPSEQTAALLPEGQNVLEAARSAFVARKLARHAKNLTDRRLAAALGRVLHADRCLKGQVQEHLDPRLIMERLVIELCLLARPAAGRGGSRA